MLLEDIQDDSGVFLNRAVAIKDNTCGNPVVIQLADKPLTAAKRRQQYLVWVVHTTESSTSSRAQPKFKQVGTFTPGEDPNIIVFAVPQEEEKMMVIQYHVHWEQELFDRLSIQRSEAVLVPGVDQGCTKYLFCQLSLDHAYKLVHQYQYSFINMAQGRALGSCRCYGIMDMVWATCSSNLKYM